MAFEKGQSGNPNGRKKGIPNKTTDEIRNLLKIFIDTNIETLQVDFDKLDSKERLLLFERLLKHILPKPLNEFEKLSDEQLDELIIKLKGERDE